MTHVQLLILRFLGMDTLLQRVNKLEKQLSAERRNKLQIETIEMSLRVVLDSELDKFRNTADVFWESEKKALIKSIEDYVNRRLRV